MSSGNSPPVSDRRWNVRRLLGLAVQFSRRCPIILHRQRQELHLLLVPTLPPSLPPLPRLPLLLLPPPRRRYHCCWRLRWFHFFLCHHCCCCCYLRCHRLGHLRSLAVNHPAHPAHPSRTLVQVCGAILLLRMVAESGDNQAYYFIPVSARRGLNGLFRVLVLTGQRGNITRVKDRSRKSPHTPFVNLVLQVF